ncbi:unnamed protein product [Schistosoma mattheei]|uniref:Uncharacterized protein n=1 Tax=Schistosoma mattheei TaxID=31246 RepID=A0A3P8J2Q4_9TREM|nr:unnamed protein product [Schistosoma mattheei]
MTDALYQSDNGKLTKCVTATLFSELIFCKLVFMCQVSFQCLNCGY